MKRVGPSMFLMLSFTLPFSSSHAQEVTAETSEQQGHALIRVIFPRAVEFTTELTERELLFQFNQELKGIEFDALPKRLPTWIEAVTTGFDTLLIRTARDVKIDVRTLKDKFGFEIDLQPNDLEGMSDHDFKGQLRLDLLQSQLYMTEGKEKEALRLSKKLADQYPDNAQVLANLASLEARSSGWRRADTLYRDALQLEPNNEEIEEARRLLFKDVAPRLAVDIDQKRVQGAQNEVLHRLEGHQLLRRYLRLGFSYDLDTASIDLVRYSDGQTGPFRGTRQRGELYLQQEFEGGLQLRGSLFAGDGKPGIGGQLLFPGFQGQTFLEVDYLRPYWEYIETLANGGTRNRLTAGRQQRLSPRLNGSLSGNFYQYGVRQTRNVASSFGMLGNLNYLLIHSHPLVSLEYDLDEEYRLAISTWTGLEGTRFNPVPLRSREVHAASALIGQDFRHRARAEAYGGFTWDRLGGHGPFGGLRLEFALTRRLEVQAKFDHRLNAINTGERVTRWGANVLWRFW